MSENLIQDLGMKYAVAKFVPWLLSRRNIMLHVANDLIQTATNEPDSLKKVITRDELWVNGYDLETKAQSSQWESPGSPWPKKVQ